MKKNEGKVKGSLVGVDGNIFCVFGYFSRLARKQGFSDEYISGVINKAKESESYCQALGVILENMEPEEDGEE